MKYNQITVKSINTLSMFIPLINFLLNHFIKFMFLLRDMSRIVACKMKFRVLFRLLRPTKHLIETPWLFDIVEIRILYLIFLQKWCNMQTRVLTSIFCWLVICKIDITLMMDYKISLKFCASIIHASMEPIISYIQEWDIMQYAFWCHFPALYSSHVSSALSLERLLSVVRNKSVVNGRFTQHLRTFIFYHY